MSETAVAPNRPFRIPLADASREIRTRPGEVYRFIQDVSTRGRDRTTGVQIVHSSGSTLEVLRHTMETPYGEIGPNGYNVMCETVWGVSIWSTLESCIERRLLVKVVGVGPTETIEGELEPIPEFPLQKPRSVWDLLMADD